MASLYGSHGEANMMILATGGNKLTDASFVIEPLQANNDFVVNIDKQLLIKCLLLKQQPSPLFSTESHIDRLVHEPKDSI